MSDGFIDGLLKELEPEGAGNHGVYVTGSRSIVAFGVRHTLKFGLNAASDARVRREYEQARAVERHPELARFVPPYAHYERGARAVLVLPLMQPVQDGKLPAVRDAVRDFLATLARFPRDQRPFREVVDSATLATFLDLTGLHHDWRRLLDRLGDEPVELGAVHGDFHLQQVLLRERQVQVIDWERFSWSGVYGSDHWSLALKYWVAHERGDWMDLWERRILTGTPVLPQLLGPQTEASVDANVATKMAFVVQTLTHNVAAVSQPAELGRAYVLEVAGIIRRLAGLAGTACSVAGKARRRAA